MVNRDFNLLITLLWNFWKSDTPSISHTFSGFCPLVLSLSPPFRILFSCFGFFYSLVHTSMYSPSRHFPFPPNLYFLTFSKISIFSFHWCLSISQPDPMACCPFCYPALSPGKHSSKQLFRWWPVSCKETITFALKWLKITYDHYSIHAWYEEIELNFVETVKYGDCYNESNERRYQPMSIKLCQKWFFYLRAFASADHIQKLLTPTSPLSVLAIFYQFSIRSRITFVEILHSRSKRKSPNKYKCGIKTLLMSKGAWTHKPMHAYIF